MMIRCSIRVVAFLGAVAASVSSGSSIPKRLRTAARQVSLLSRAATGGSNAFDPNIVYAEFLNQCAGANLDMDTCLILSTISAFMAMENGPQRKLQEGCDGPDINEQDLRLIMDGTKAQCIQSGVSITNAEFESTVAGFMTIFGSDCFCSDDEESMLMLMEITLDAAADCAQVELDMPKCLKDHVILTLSSGNPPSDSATDGGIQRKLQDPTASPCDQSNLLAGLAMYASTMIEDGKGKCAAQDVSVGTDQLIKAYADLVSIFSAQQCWGVTSDTGCEGGMSDDDLGNSGGGFDGLGVAISYIEQCAGIDINMDSCLASTSISAILPVAFSQSQSQPTRGRLLQLSGGESECIAPELNEQALRYIVGESALQCSSKGVDATNQEIEQTVKDFTAFFGAQECWVALCEEQANPTDEFYKLVFEEIAQCAGAHFNWNPCLVDQFFALLISGPGGSLEGVRRKLQGSFETCASESSEAEFTFVVTFLVAGANEKCLELGEIVAPDDVAEAEAELLKLFTAQQCWGTPIDCPVPENDYRSAYLNFIEERINMMLGGCVGSGSNTCVFQRSIEVMHGMTLLGWSQDGHSDLPQVASDQSTLCVPPAVSEVEIDKIAKHAQAFCVSSGSPALEADEYNNTVMDLNLLVAEPSCWDDICQPAVKDFIMGEWMGYCTSMNLEFLFNQVQSNTALDIDMVKCMVNYILSTEEESDEALTCEPPLPGLGECGLDIGEEAFVQCGGVINVPSTTTEPPMQFSMSFSMNFNVDDWFPNEGNGQEVGVYIVEACNVIEFLHSNMTLSCLEPICDGLWIEDTLTVADGIGGETDDVTDDNTMIVDDDVGGIGGETDDGTDDKTTVVDGTGGEDDDGTDGTTVVEAPTGSSPLTPPPTKQPTPNPTSKPSPPVTKTNGSHSSGRAAAVSFALVFTSILMV
jgi:hypothetical protein